MMKTSIERLEENKLRLDVEVPETVVKDAFDETLVLMGRELNMPGFRPGKVPPQAVLARLGRDAVVSETIRIFLDNWYSSAVMASGIRPVAQPEIEFADEETGFGGPVRFSATVEVAPKPKLPELSSIEVDKPNMPDTQKYVDQVLEQTLQGAGELVDVTREIAQGDEVVVDFTCEIDGEVVAGAGAVGYQAKIGDGRLLPELEEGIVGKKVGDKVDVPVNFQDDHPMEDLAGKSGVFHVTIGSVQELKLPELTDEVASQVSEFPTADALLEDIRTNITKRLENEVKGIFRGNAVEAFTKAVELDAPEALVQNRQQEMFSGMKQQLEQMGLSIEQYMAHAGRDTTEMFAEMETSAREDVKRELVLLSLAEDANIEVSESDLRAEIADHAEQTGRQIEEAIQQVYDSGRIDLLRGELLIQRAIDHLVEKVKPVAVDLPTEEEAMAEAEAKNEEAVTNS